VTGPNRSKRNVAYDPLKTSRLVEMYIGRSYENQNIWRIGKGETLRMGNLKLKCKVEDFFVLPRVPAHNPNQCLRANVGIKQD
jgi:hypothetical protein